MTPYYLNETNGCRLKAISPRIDRRFGENKQNYTIRRNFPVVSTRRMMTKENETLSHLFNKWILISVNLTSPCHFKSRTISTVAPTEWQMCIWMKSKWCYCDAFPENVSIIIYYAKTGKEFSMWNCPAPDIHAASASVNRPRFDYVMSRNKSVSRFTLFMNVDRCPLPTCRPQVRPVTFTCG